MIFRTIVLLLACLVSSSCSRTVGEPLSASILDFGTYSVETTGVRTPASGTVHGELAGIKGQIQLIESTDTVPAVTGTWFGFRFLLHGHPAGMTERITFRTLHPSLRNPQREAALTESVLLYDCPVGVLLRSVYQLEYEWEAIPGEWTMQICSGDRVLASKTFTVRIEEHKGVEP